MTSKVEIGQYRPVNKGALKAYFSVTLHPEAIQIMDCVLFESNGKKWFNFPQKAVQKEGQKTNYYPYIRILDKKTEESLKELILKQLETAEPAEPFYDKKSQSNTPRPSFIPSESSDLWYQK